ncbi:MAG: PAS domain S-box protein [Proteobacteria bacterium]|nr:PAS domain S-box protein [Pseudomonadota bacterium]NIS69681.1 PAS domain S-box protein [Pseudomonadota bacterium]
MVDAERPTGFNSEDLLTAVFEAMPLAMLLVESSLIIRWASKKGAILFGCEQETLVGQSIRPNQNGHWTLVDGHDFHEKIRNLFRSGDSITGEEQIISLYSNGKRIERHIRMNASLLESADTPLVLMAIEDITPLKELEEKSKETERLSLSIQMIRNAIHDLNQPLSALVGNLDLLEQHLSVDAPLRARVEKILESANGVTEVVRRLQMIVHAPKKREVLRAGTTRPMAYGRIDRGAGHDSP